MVRFGSSPTYWRMEALAWRTGSAKSAGVGNEPRRILLAPVFRSVGLQDASLSPDRNPVDPEWAPAETRITNLTIFWPR